MYALLAAGPDSSTAVVQLRHDDGAPAAAPQTIQRAQLAVTVRELEQAHQPRWVWDRAVNWYPQLLAADVRVEKCHDLALCQTILLFSEFAAATGYHQHAATLPPERQIPALHGERPPSGQDSLFDAPVAKASAAAWDLDTVFHELDAQKTAINSSTHPARLTLLLIAESAGALVAAEMQYAGIPWREDLHRRLLNDLLGP